MALNKKILLKNGIITNYHRIVSLNKIINVGNIIEVASYTNTEKRIEEKEYYQSQNPKKTMDVFINTTFYKKPYLDNETITETYNYLKTLDEFKDSTDV